MKLEDDGIVESIWTKISTKADKELWDEFAEAYRNPQDKKYRELIQFGGAVGLPDLRLIKAQLHSSHGYRLYKASRPQSAAEIGMFAHVQHESFTPKPAKCSIQ